MRILSFLFLTTTIFLNSGSLLAADPVDLLQNGNFDAHIEHWTPCCGNVEWASEDASTDLGATPAASGSLRISIPEASPEGAGISAEQCIASVANQKYFLSAAIKLLDNENIGDAAIWLRCWTETECKGNQVQSTPSFLLADKEMKGKWIAYGVYMSASEESKSCSLVLWAGNNSSGPFEASFDRLSLQTSGPAPGENAPLPGNSGGCSLKGQSQSVSFSEWPFLLLLAFSLKIYWLKKSLRFAIDRR